jgi:hypothetical protein
MQDVGKVASIATRRVGTALVGDHAVGVSSLFVYDAFDFDETGGEMQVGDTVLVYTGWSTDDDDPDAPDVVMLAAPTAVAFEDGLQAWVLPLSNVTTAAVILDETGEALDDVVVPQHLVPTLLDGVRLTHDATVAEEGVTEVLADAETVTVREDEYGEWEVVSVDRAKAVLDGGLIDPDTTIPPAALTDGNPPSTAPTLEAFAATDFVAVRLSEITNADPVQVRVLVSTNPAGPFVQVGVVENGGVGAVRAISGAPLAQGVDYYFRAVPFDADGDGPTSTTVGPIRLSKIVRTQIGDNEIQTYHLAADVITADLLVANDALIEALRVSDLSAVNLEGVSIVGGTISIAEGSSGQYLETWSGLDDPGLPVGSPTPDWVLRRTDPSRERLKFVSTREAGEAQALLRAVVNERAAAGDRNDFDFVYLSKPSVLPEMSQDTIVTFDVRRTGGANWSFFAGMLLREQDQVLDGIVGNDAVDLQIKGQGRVRLLADIETVGGLDNGLNFTLPVDVWHTFEVVVRGSSVSFAAKPRGATAWAYQWSGIIPGLTPAPGRVGFYSRTDSHSSNEPLDAQLEFDNIDITALATGLQVDPSGATRVSDLKVGALAVSEIATVPDPLMPDHAANKGYVDTAMVSNFSMWQDTSGLTPTGYLRFFGSNPIVSGAWSMASTSPYAFTCITPGVYAVVCSLVWEANSTGRRTLVWELDGDATPQIERSDMVPNGSYPVGQQIMFTRRFAAGQTVSFRTVETSGVVGELDILRQRVTFTREGA